MMAITQEWVDKAESDFATAGRELAVQFMAGFQMNADQDDYFDAVATFVEKYEAERHSIAGAALTPIQLIRSLLEAHDMTASDLGRLLGDRSLGHRILSGQRQLSKAHIRALADHFRLNPAALL